MLSVNTNAMALKVLQNLDDSARQLRWSQDRVNSGLKVASAKDDSAIYAIAQRMRGDVAGFNAVQQSLDRAISEVDVAISGAEAISDLLIEMKEKAVAAVDPGLDLDSKQALNDEFIELRDQIDSISNNANFNGRNLLTGDTLAAIADASGSSANAIVSTFEPVTLNSLGLEDVSLAAPSGYTRLPAGHQISWVNQTSAWAMSEYVIAYHPAIASNPTLFDSVTAHFFDAPSAATVMSALETHAGLTPGSLSYDGAYIVTGADELAYNNADLKFVTPADNVDFGDPQEAVDALETAIDQVNETLSTLGSASKRLEIQKGFTVKLSDGITSGIGNLVDADMAKESAALVARQTKQQLGLEALIVANRQPQILLSLFR